MGRMSIFAFFLLITSIVCDDNNVTTLTPLSSITTTTTTKISSTNSDTTTTIATPTTNSQSSSISSVTSSSTTTASPTLENASTTSKTTTQLPLQPTIIKPNTLSSNRSSAATQCNCDLTLNCDFNCCCDLDCSDGIVEAFDCNAVDIDIEDFYHDEGLERCGIDNGLLCIANIPSASVDIESSIHMPFHVEYVSYRWPKILLEPDQQQMPPQHQQQHSDNNFYKYGDAIVTYNRKTENFQTIKVPTYTMGDNSRCFLNEPVKFLNTQSIKCLRSINELCSYNNQLMSQLLNSQMFHFRPPSMNMKASPTSTTKMTDQEASDDGGGSETAFNIVVESCKHSFDNCTQISYVNDANGKNTSNSTADSSKEVEVLEFLGDDVYENIQIEFVINGTKIVSASAKFTCRNNLICGNNDDLDPTKLVQNIEVQFRNFNENDDDAEKGEKRIRDAPHRHFRGFNDGDIILVSRQRPINETAPSTSDLVLDFFRNDTSASNDHFNLKLPDAQDGGKCLIDKNYDVVRFNENSQTRCTVELRRDENLNFTVCQHFQHQLIHFLFSTLNLTSNYSLDGYLSDVFISKFWTPSRDVSSSWTRVSFIKMPLWNVEMQESEKIITCLNMVTAANYKFIYSTRKISGANRYQHIIENLHVEFEQIEEIKFLSDDDYQHVDIQINVQFINKKLHDNVKNFAVNNIANYHFLFIIFCIFKVI